MSDSNRFSTFLLAALVLLAVLVACSQQNSQEGAGGAPGRGVYVPEVWSTNRRVTGHRVHVVEQKIACDRCHELTGTSLGAVSPRKCAQCHEGPATIEHAARLAQERFGPGVHAVCVNCHAFSNGGQLAPETDGGVLEPYTPADCARCHSKAQGEIPAVTVHASTACLNCHHPHKDPQPISADCASCHRDVLTTHAAEGKTANQVCTTCHTHQHAPASDALGTCVGCHSKKQPIVPASALFAGGHEQCVNCHRPHEFRAQGAVDCRSCHQGVLVLAAAEVPAHGVCTSCHAPHDVRANPAAACANCHQSVHSDHPEHFAGAGCVGCHNPHPTREQAQVVAKPCSSCHHLAATDHDFHSGVACDKCHVPHHFSIQLAQHVACSRCHERQTQMVSLRTGHAACENCHAGLPHRPTPANTACVGCHASEHHDARPGHQACTGCHEPHSGAAAVPCQTCHAQEFASAPAGHRACTSCHQPHTGSTAKVACATCHAPEASSPHGKLASGCTTCHRAHGPSGLPTPPACTSCHAPTSLPGLHQKPQHQLCSRCHSGHGDAPNAQRLVCLSCHADRQQHFPNAPRCANCHLFQRAETAVTAH